MLGWGGRQNGQINGDDQPLLQSSHEHGHEDSENTLFAVEDEDNTSVLEDSHTRGKADHTVRFQDQVQVIAPPLRSTLESREAGVSSVFVLVSSLRRLPLHLEYELDSDDIDDETAAQSSIERGTHRANRSGEQSMPLLVGLLDASTMRRSLDIPMGVDGVSAYDDVDLDELAAKQSSGGGILNSIANMSNSILGAGACFACFGFPSLWCLLSFFPQGIIGTPSRGNSLSLPGIEHLLRFALCHESRGVRYRTVPPGRSLLCHGLDYLSHSHKRKAQRHELIHWDNEPFLWR